MRSTFHGLETSKRALFVQRAGMNTLGHNISNANTDGYSRQRVNISATNALESPAWSRSTAPGQLGTGVQYDSITRIRDEFLDFQYRRENQTYGEWSVREQTNMTIESIINEPTESGIRAIMDRFWDSWEALNRDPGLLSARANVKGEALNLVDALNHMGKMLNNLENDINTNIMMKTNEANNLIQSIAELNNNIRKIEALGDNANDLKDKRDLQVDKLSKLMDVELNITGNDYVITAEGVEVINNNNFTLLTEANVENASSGELKGYIDSKNIDITTIRNQLNAMVNTLVTGKVSVTLPEGYIAARDIVSKTDVTLSDGTVIAAGDTIPAGSTLSESAEVEVEGFNGLHELGYGLQEPTQSGIPFFVNNGGGSFTIDNIKLNPDIINDTNNIAASGNYEVVTLPDGTTENKVIKGNSDIAHLLAGLRDKSFDFPNQLTSFSTGTIDDYFRAMTGEFGVRSFDATRNRQNQQDLTDAIDIRRKSISSVSLDEEMADLIKFQHAYNAAARNMTTVDEMLDRIINKMGIVGR